jgi:hypothetical protein
MLLLRKPRNVPLTDRKCSWHRLLSIRRRSISDQDSVPNAPPYRTTFDEKSKSGEKVVLCVEKKLSKKLYKSGSG